MVLRVGRMHCVAVVLGIGGLYSVVVVLSIFVAAIEVKWEGVLWVETLI